MELTVIWAMDSSLIESIISINKLAIKMHGIVFWTWGYE